ncbi:Brp/Blh family beta-carotene 15,15'-dioxygenase [Micromonospora sp. WMMD882]|uniref:Brp/Blh family beta-carotene 15,15'-dioxygenase n=1 Tax=Micromonospora sp. WMMD882 TaxID=3015151 RepID=UPI00248CDBC2|nr:Brp/Blh family beta-carotene 15,15'-dioxygenase [Micromonospora sp. WMMD882]WBB79243.1 Brp/Blh family beta-carotene 15,15'-dioxygenase [Micromonospora sp. WMMD882]
MVTSPSPDPLAGAAGPGQPRRGSGPTDPAARRRTAVAGAGPNGPGHGPDRPDRLLWRAGTASQLALGGLLALSPLIRAAGLGDSSVLLIAGLLLGLPHGAVDHLVPAWLSARARPLPARVALLVAYAGTAAVGLAVFRAAPDLALIGFLLLSIVHFGAADEAFHAERDHRRSRPSAHAVLAYGGPPVVVPLALWPNQVDPLLAQVAPRAPALLTTEARMLALVTVLAAVGFTVVRELRAGRARDAVPPLLLTGLFGVVPPALAIGAYFAAWHSCRHVARLTRHDPRNTADLEAGRVGPPLRRFARQAAAPTVVAVAALIALVTWPGHRADPLPATFAVLAALTLPHAALVAWADRRHTPAPRPPGWSPRG